MRSRNIKPGFFKNEILGTKDPILSLLFAGLWCLADSNGVVEDRPLRIKAEIFPYRDGLDIHGELTELSRLGFIQRYKVDGKDYLQVKEFNKHQSPHHTEKKSGFPVYSDSCDLTVNSPLNNGGNPPDSLIPDSLIPDSGFTEKVGGSNVINHPKANTNINAMFFSLANRQPNGFEAKTLVEIKNAYPQDKIEYAFKEAGNAGANLKYVLAVLEGRGKKNNQEGGIYRTPKGPLDGWKPPHVIELEKLAREQAANAGQ